MQDETQTEKKHPQTRRSWRRSRISIPDRTSSLHQTPRKTKSKPKTKRPDSISLHNRSCKLFSSIDEILALTRETPPPRYSEATSRPRTRQSSKVDYTASEKAPLPSVDVSSTSSLLPHSADGPRRDSGYSEGQTDLPRPAYNAVMSWTSDETRRKEYKKIDRAYSGWRGIVNKVLPKSWRYARRNFFRGDDNEDEDSVRRFRVSLPEKTEKLCGKGKWACF